MRALMVQGVLAAAVMVGGCAIDDGADLDADDTALDEASLAEDEAALTAVPDPRVPGPHSVLFEREANIAAPPSRVFEVIADVDAYASWNPWVIHAEGDVYPGGTVTVDVVMNGRQQRATHEVLVVEPDSRFCWKDSGWNAWFVYGQRCRWLTVNADGSTHYRVQLLIDGPLSGLAKLIYGAATEAGLTAETAALARRAAE